MFARVVHECWRFGVGPLLCVLFCVYGGAFQEVAHSMSRGGEGERDRTRRLGDGRGWVRDAWGRMGQRMREIGGGRGQRGRGKSSGERETRAGDAEGEEEVDERERNGQ